MISISVSDIVKLLDQIPIWKSLRELPKRVTELESRLAQLEGALKIKASEPKPLTGRECPMCDAKMVVTKEDDDADFGFAGVKVHQMKCDTCGHTTTRQFDPRKGYL